MRKINKSGPIEDYKKINFKEISNWDVFVKCYRIVYYNSRSYILEQEQNGLSGYTEKKINETKNIHIDHFLKKGLFSNDFDWNVFIVDEIESKYGACFKDEHIHSKNENKTLINPVEEDPHEFFTYMSNGEIIPRSDLCEENKERARFTIKAFNLNHNSLKEQRSNIVFYFNTFSSQLSIVDIEDSLKGLGFPSAIEYIKKLYVNDDQECSDFCNNTAVD